MADKQLIDNQEDFERAYLQSKGEIHLAPGYYQVPHPENENTVYIFDGIITGSDDMHNRTFLNGELGTNGHLILKNVVLVNPMTVSFTIMKGATGVFDNVTFAQTATQPQMAIDCMANSQLVLSHSKISYDNCFSGEIVLHENVSAVINDSHLASLTTMGNSFGNLSMNKVAIGRLIADGDWQIVANDLTLYTNKDNAYVHCTTDDPLYPKVGDKRWIVFLDKSQLIARNIHLPKKLPANLAPIVVRNGNLIGNITDDHLGYAPWIEAEGSQIVAQGAVTTPISRRDVNTPVDDEGAIDRQQPNDNHSPHPTTHDSLKKLQSLIGLSKVKEQVDAFIKMALMNKRRKEQGMKPLSNSFHSLFEGNPGTGKTTVARLVGRIMYEEGILPTDKYVEVDRGQLVAGFVGQTATKTEKILKEATGGVLFVDEAYDLVHGNDDSFGREALDTIMKYMEDHREELMIIFAGYTDNMEALLKQNPGMKSRVPNVFTFEDYSPEEIAAIGRLQLQRQQLKFDQPSTEELYNQLVAEQYVNTNDHSNGRWIRNQNDKLTRQLAVTTGNDQNHPLDVVTAADIQAAFGGSSSYDNGSQSSQGNSADDDSPFISPDDDQDDDSLPLINGDELK